MVQILSPGCELPQHLLRSGGADGDSVAPSLPHEHRGLHTTDSQPQQPVGNSAADPHNGKLRMMDGLQLSASVQALPGGLGSYRRASGSPPRVQGPATEPLPSTLGRYDSHSHSGGTTRICSQPDGDLASPDVLRRFSVGSTMSLPEPGNELEGQQMLDLFDLDVRAPAVHSSEALPMSTLSAPHAYSPGLAGQYRWVPRPSRHETFKCDSCTAARALFLYKSFGHCRNVNCHDDDAAVLLVAKGCQVAAAEARLHCSPCKSSAGHMKAMTVTTAQPWWRPAPGLWQL